MDAVPPPPGSHPNTPALPWGQYTPVSSFMYTPIWAQPPHPGYIPSYTGISPYPVAPWVAPPPGAFVDLQGGMLPLPYMYFASPYHAPYPMGLMTPPGMISAPDTAKDNSTPPGAGPSASRSMSTGGHPSSSRDPPPDGKTIKARGIGKGRPQPSSEPKYGGTHRAAQQQHWRSDFTTKTGFGSFVSKFGSAGVRRENIDDIKRKAGFHLEWNRMNPPLYYDMRQRYTENPESLRFPSNGRRITSDLDLSQLACIPAAHTIHLWHKRLPWYITIEAKRENSITVSDLLSQLHEQLSISVTEKDYWNKEIGQVERERMFEAWWIRCRLGGSDFGREKVKVMKRVDFFGDECILRGIVRVKDGMWEMKVESSESMLKY